MMSVMDSKSGEYKVHKSMKLRNIAHHITAIDYNDSNEKILVTTLNEKIQVHSIDPEVTKHDVIKIKDSPSGHFLLEYDDNRSAVFGIKYCETNGSKCIVLCNDGFHLVDVEKQW
jgi:hypothetical protein